tara:strand:- start:1136 stop:3166 length:2031 start_codon:yes stop_codon:yes gene_type:complete
MRTVDDLKRWKEYGLVLTPIIDGTKAPGVKKGDKWKFDWSDDVLLNSKRLGFFHKESGVFTLDFDDKDYIAHKYMRLFPPTMRDGKTRKYPDEHLDTYVGTHLTYKVNGQGALDFKYPSKAKGKDDGLLIETLSATQTIFTGEDRHEETHIIPQDVDIKYLEKLCKLTCFFAEVEKQYTSIEGHRDEFNLIFTGCLARLNEQEYPTDLLNKFHEKFLHNVGDTQEIKNRLKIARQRRNLETGKKKVFGITELRNALDAELKAYSLFNAATDDDVQEEDLSKFDPKEYPLINGNDFDLIEYPSVEYLVNPIINTRSFNQTYGWYESGKSVFGMALAMSMCSGHEFLGWTIDKKIPTAYLESELPGATIKGVRDTVKLGWLDKNLTFNNEWHFSLNQDDLINAGFKYGFSAIAVAKVHGKEAAKDYGRRGREMIEDWLHKIEKKTGHKPFYFLDNMTKLSTIDENKAQDWNPFLNWGTDLKHKGFSGMFVHHANKGDGKKGSSGSSTIGRLLDTSIQLTKLDPDYRFDIPGQKSLQSSIEFDKSRGFGGSEWSKKRIITMNEGGEWKHYPYLKQDSFEILKLHKQGLTQQEIREMANNKEIGTPPLSAPSVDRKYLELVKLQLIEKKRETRCWNCKAEISTDEDGSCEKCGTGIPCSECGKCICERPKQKNKNVGFKL